MAARDLFKGYFEFTPTAKFWLATNHKPEVRGTGEAIWRRIRLVPFTVTVPVEQRNPHLLSILRKERAGVLRWAVDGALAWQQQGLGLVSAVAEATDAYLHEMDIVGQFIEDQCVLGAEQQATARDLYGAFQKWAYEQGYAKPWSQKRLGMALGDREGLASKKTGHAKIVTWFGIGLRSTGGKISLKAVQ